MAKAGPSDVPAERKEHVMSFPEADILRREAAALAELAALQRDPAYLGVGLPRGDGRLVLVLPGLFGNDFYLQPLHHWLRRLGYRSAHSTLLVNAAAPSGSAPRSRSSSVSVGSGDPVPWRSSATAAAACSPGPSPAACRMTPRTWSCSGPLHRPWSP